MAIRTIFVVHATDKELPNTGRPLAAFDDLESASTYASTTAPRVVAQNRGFTCSTLELAVAALATVGILIVIDSCDLFSDANSRPQRRTS